MKMYCVYNKDVINGNPPVEVKNLIGYSYNRNDAYEFYKQLNDNYISISKNIVGDNIKIPTKFTVYEYDDANTESSPLVPDKILIKRIPLKTYGGGYILLTNTMIERMDKLYNKIISPQINAIIPNMTLIVRLINYITDKLVLMAFSYILKYMSYLSLCTWRNNDTIYSIASDIDKFKKYFDLNKFVLVSGYSLNLLTERTTISGQFTLITHTI